MPVNTKYKNYSVKDFLKDDLFLQWQLLSTETLDNYWKQVLQENPHQEANITNAIRTLHSIAINRSALSCQKEDEILKNIYARYHRHKIRRFIYWTTSVAAGLILLFFSVSPLTNITEENINVMLSDVQSVRLDTIQDVRLIKGNEFRVTFEDGTTVHLNYNTEIRYPVKFSKTKRMVYLKGEAYFKIAKDTRPFYVITDQGIIKQYGTEFNVNTFTSGRTEVALVKGSISIIPQGSTQEQLIEPGQLAHIEQKGNNISIYNVDLTPYIAWNEGRLIFENRTLENIVEILEHWYNVNISFGTSELKQLRFTGNMDRYATISPILKAIARTTNLQIKIEGREILITDN